MPRARCRTLCETSRLVLADSPRLEFQRRASETHGEGVSRSAERGVVVRSNGSWTLRYGCRA
jgi:hypothetical protein